jgi:phospholipid/cholesterol/gamma-HCH transport system permease protein
VTSVDSSSASGPRDTREPVPVAVLGGLGARLGRSFDGLIHGLAVTGGVASLLCLAFWHGIVMPLCGRNRYKGQLVPMLTAVGVRSFPITMLVAILSGIILVLQMGDVLKTYGQLQEVSGVVALAMTRELGPLLTAVVLTARVGASFTAVLAAMQINEEILALRTMAIDPVAWLVAPRFVSILVMVPCLTILGFFVGMAGGAIIANLLYGIPFELYVEKAKFYLDMGDILSGLIKSFVFGILITGVCCYYGFAARGGPTGLGRYIMVSVVTAIVLVVFADALMTALAVRYVWSQ